MMIIEALGDLQRVTRLLPRLTGCCGSDIYKVADNCKFAEFVGEVDELSDIRSRQSNFWRTGIL